MERRVLVITTVSGFLWQFERNTVELLKKEGAEIHYASNFQRPAYEFEESFFEENGIRTHHVPIEKLPWKIIRNLRALKRLTEIIRSEKIDTVHCHNPVGGLLGRLAALLSGSRTAVIYTAHGLLPGIDRARHRQSGCWRDLRTLWSRSMRKTRAGPAVSA